MTARLRAPREDGAVVAVPPLEEGARLDDPAVRNLRDSDYDVQGRRLSAVRALARHELCVASRQFLKEVGGSETGPCAPRGEVPWVVSGHQPELFHAGVWLKNFAAGALGRARGGQAVHVIIDNDLPKAVGVRAPVVEGGALRSEHVDFALAQPEAPYEEWRIDEWALFESFGARLAERVAPLIPDPLAREFWPRVVDHARSEPLFGVSIARARREVEASWGLQACEVPLGRLCAGDAFRWFLTHILAQLPRFRAIHNDELARYRAAAHVRSANHPVPDLRTVGEWLEAPFWAWRAGSPRRRPLLARQRDRVIELAPAGDTQRPAEIPLRPDGEACCAVEALRSLEETGLRIRSRALTTTMFLRLFLADLFIHGIGGAHYDELGDQIVRRFFGFEPPRFLTLSMTAWVGLPVETATHDDLRRVLSELRDLTFNPDRHIHDPPPEARSWIEAKHEALAASQARRRDRVERWRRLRKCNAALARFVEPRRRLLEDEAERLRALLAWNSIAQRRDYAFVLHNARRLRTTFERVLSPIGGW